MPDHAQLKKVAPRLTDDKARNIWFASLRANGRPHLVPLWFVWHADKLWVCIGRDTQKHANIKRNHNVALALEDGLSPVIVEGAAREEASRTQRDQLARLFSAKYDWDFQTDSDEDWLLVSVTPQKIMTW